MIEVPHDIPNITQIVGIEAIIGRYSEWMPVTRAGPGVVNLWVNETNICVESGSAARNTWQGYATLKYTRLA
jgi:hypothetical protein